MAHQERLIDGMRGVRYGEVLPVFLRDEGLVAEVYGTQMLNDCPQDLWEALDPAAIAAETGAVCVKMNGPREWLLDGLGTKVAPVEPVIREFETGLAHTIRWYLDHEAWWRPIRDKAYAGQRLGVKA